MHRPEGTGGVSPGLDAPGFAFLLDASECAFVVRLCQMTPMPRRYTRPALGTVH